MCVARHTGGAVLGEISNPGSPLSEGAGRVPLVEGLRTETKTRPFASPGT